MKVKVDTHKITIEGDIETNAGEYNVTPCEFNFSNEYDDLTKMAVFSTCNDVYKVAILNDECTIPEEALRDEGQVLLGVFAYENTNDELVLRYSPIPRYFNVTRGSYREGNDPVLPAPTEWERVLALINQAITETNNLNIQIDKENKVTHVTLTKKDGTTETVDIEDGKSLEFNWRGTELGVRVEGESSYEYVNLKGDKGDAGAIKMQIVAELPQTGQDDTIYLVPLDEPESQENKYAEYVWINGEWELLGKIGIQVDLTDYVKYTDYATDTTSGVVITSSSNGIGTTSAGNLYAREYSYSQYQTKSNNMFISKGTLEAVITGKNIETANNKTTTLSSASTDTQYPSAKCVYDIIGNLETILTTLDVGGGAS